MIDAAIIGGGPAALSAALYLARANKSVQVFERGQIGGELSRIDQIENYPGYRGSGAGLADIMRSQVEAAGAEIQYGECTAVERQADGTFLLTIDGEPLAARTVLVATGSEPCRLAFEPEQPVSYCALCDGALVKGKRVVIIGGGNSALQGALYLAAIAAVVTIISHSALKADAHLQSRVRQLENITIRENLEPTPALLADFDHVFVFIGTRPATQWLQSLSAASSAPTNNAPLFDAAGYILTGGVGRSAHAAPLPGLYAAGDVRAGAVKQVATAAGDGVTAAVEMIDWLKTAPKA